MPKNEKKEKGWDKGENRGEELEDRGKEYIIYSISIVDGVVTGVKDVFSKT